MNPSTCLTLYLFASALEPVESLGLHVNVAARQAAPGVASAEAAFVATQSQVIFAGVDLGSDGVCGQGLVTLIIFSYQRAKQKGENSLLVTSLTG